MNGAGSFLCAVPRVGAPRAASGRLLAAVILLLVARPASCHVGDQNVFFEGQAGAYPVRVTVRPPGVIPGLAEISIRVRTNGVEGVTVLPMRWNTGRQGAPPADEAPRVRGESNLFTGQLWFMRDGAQGVEVEVRGRAGRGKVIVPVNAVATRVMNMPDRLGWILGLCGGVLVLLAICIAGAAVRESVLPAGTLPTARRRWVARGITVAAALVAGGAIWFGKNWWDAEARDYRNNRLYQPIPATASLREARAGGAGTVLTIEREVDPARRYGPLVPEHGKLMHLFLVREPRLDAFAHVHPVKRSWNIFETPLPPLPPGEYRVYADITYEAGFAETLTAVLAIPEAPKPPADASAFDVDDAWCRSEPFAVGNRALAQTNRVGDLRMELALEAPLVANRDTALRVQVREADGRPVLLRPYMGMAGHLIVRREDGAVFTHLHPGGSFSMTAQQLFELRAEGKAPLKVAAATGDPICRLPVDDPRARAMALAQERGQIRFPYAFPKPGGYRLWVQVKVDDRPLTGVFDVRVAPDGAGR